MSDRERNSRLVRRKFLKYAAGTGTAISLGLAGCSERSEDGGDGGSGSDGSGGTDGGSGSGGGDGGDGDDGGSGGDGGQGTTQDPTVDEYVLGSNHPLSGFLGQDGQKLDQAVRLAAEMKNEEGGIEALGGAEVKVVSGDNEAKQELGAPVTENLIDQGANAIIGCYTSPVTIAAAGAAEQNQTPMVVSVASSPKVLQGRGFDYVYRHQPPAPVQGRDYCRWVPQIIRNAGHEIETVGIFHINNEYGAATADGVEANAPDNGLEVVERLSYDLGDDNFTTQMTKMADTDPDAIATTTYGSAGPPLISALNNVGWFPKWLTAPGSTAFSTNSIIEQMGQDANNAFHCSFAMNTNHSRFNTISQAYKEKTGEAISSNPMMAFIAADIILKAVERAGTADNDAVQQAIGNTNIENPLIANGGPLKFKDNGENANAIAPITQVQDLESKLVYPERFADAEPEVVPHPKA